MARTADYAPLVALAFGWFAFALVFALRRRPPAGAAPTAARDASAWWGVALQAASYGVVGASPTRRPIGAPFGGIGVLRGWLLGVVVGALMVLSVAFVQWAVVRLGRHWALAARVVEDHALIMEGPYGVVRHPIYTGMVGMLVATGLAVAGPLSLASGLAVMAVGTWVRVRAEERLLRGAFGDAYEAYTARVPAVVPGWGRLGRR